MNQKLQNKMANNSVLGYIPLVHLVYFSFWKLLLGTYYRKDITFV